MNSREYWIEREKLKQKQQDVDLEKIDEFLLKQYKKASKELEKELLYLLNRYMTQTGLNYNQAIKTLNNKEFKEFKYDLKTYMELIEQTGNEKLLLELNTLAMRTRINRLENIMFQISKIANELTEAIEEELTKVLTEEFKKSYYVNIFNIHQNLGFGYTFAKIDNEELKEIFKLPWSGLNYSERVWLQRNQLLYKIQEVITQMIIQGQGMNEASKKLLEQTGDIFNPAYGLIFSHLKSAKRLVRTEFAYVTEQATLKSYETLGLKKYEILATLDKKTSNVCQKLDGKVYKLSEASVGINYPPFHPFCRTTTIPYFSEKEGTRFARDGSGKPIEVPSNMKYDEWYRKFVK